MLSRLSHNLIVAFAMLGLASPMPAWAQAHERRDGGYTVRSSAVGSENLSQATARANGIERSPTRGVVNVTVSKGERTVPASVTVEARNLTGRARAVPMRQTVAGDYVSYTGTYDFVNSEVLDFVVRARPEGSKQELSLTFRERMWANSDVSETPPSR